MERNPTGEKPDSAPKPLIPPPSPCVPGPKRRALRPPALPSPKNDCGTPQHAQTTTGPHYPPKGAPRDPSESAYRSVLSPPAATIAHVPPSLPHLSRRTGGDLPADSPYLSIGRVYPSPPPRPRAPARVSQRKFQRYPSHPHPKTRGNRPSPSPPAQSFARVFFRRYPECPCYRPHGSGPATAWDYPSRSPSVGARSRFQPKSEDCVGLSETSTPSTGARSRLPTPCPNLRAALLFRGAHRG